jgi:hypothetical protein
MVPRTRLSLLSALGRRTAQGMHRNETTSRADAGASASGQRAAFKGASLPLFRRTGKWEMGRKDSGLGGDRGKVNRSGEEGLIVGRAAWDSAGSRMPFASGGQDIGQAIKSADGAATMALLRFVMGTAPGARGAWQSRQQTAESREQSRDHMVTLASRPLLPRSRDSGSGGGGGMGHGGGVGDEKG